MTDKTLHLIIDLALLSPFICLAVFATIGSWVVVIAATTGNMPRLLKWLGKP